MFLNSQNIFFVGIKGAAMANLARIAVQLGKLVSGSDVKDSFITDKIVEEMNLNIIDSFEADRLPEDVDLVIYSAGHGGRGNPQVLEAEERGIKTVHQSAVLGELLTIFKTSAAVAGCHGKTTTTALLAYSLKKLSDSVSYMAGVSEFMGLPGGDYNGKEYFIVEADEYGIDPPENITPKFDFLDPNYAIITNIDFDHPDVYLNLDGTVKAFTKFISKIISKQSLNPRIVINGDDKNLRKIAANYLPKSYISYGFGKNDLVVSQIQVVNNKTRFILNSNRFNIKNKEISISLFGDKNVLNTAAVIALLLGFGFEIDHIAKAIYDFAGVKRRLEYIETKKNIIVYDDYAHHPEEISATIQAARSLYPQKRLVILFQPHTYSRTEALKNEFVEALAKADLAFLLPVFGSAREQAGKDPYTSRKLWDLAQSTGKKNIKSLASADEAVAILAKELKSKDLFFTMGAGDVYKLGSKVLKEI